MKLNEMIALRATKNEEFQNMELTAETREAFDTAENELKELDADIARLEAQEKRNAAMASVNFSAGATKDDDSVNFERALGEYFTSGGNTISSEFRGSEGIIVPNTVYRADPVVTTTDTGVINKIVEPGINIKESYGIQFMRDLGVNFIEGATGNIVMPSAAEVVAYNSLEGIDSSSANMTPESVTYSAKRVDYSQGFSVEFLSQSNLYQSALQALINGVGVKELRNFFANMAVDAIDASVAGTAAGVTYKDLLDLKANLQDVYGPTSYVMTPAGEAYLRDLNAGGAGVKFALSDNNTIAGIPAVAASAVGTGDIWIGEWNKADFVTFGNGGVELIVDPYTLKKKGLVEITARSLSDSGTANYRNFSWIADGSIG